MEVPFAPRPLTARRSWQLLELHRPALELAGHPASVLALWVRTEALRQLVRLPKALSAAQQAMAQASQSASTFAALARMCGQQAHLGPAVDAIQESLRLNPLNANSYALLAQLQYRLHGTNKTVTSAKSGLFLDIRHINYLLWRILVQEQPNQPAAANHDFQQLLCLALNSALAHAQRGKQLLHQCALQTAAVHLAAALQLVPTRSTELVPLLRRARREQHWPAWLMRRRWQLRQEWQEQHVLNYRDGNTLMLLPFIWRRGWGRTRHDPLFQDSCAQVHQLRLKLWPALLTLLAMLILLSDYFGLVVRARRSAGRK